MFIDDYGLRFRIDKIEDRKGKVALNAKMEEALETNVYKEFKDFILSMPATPPDGVEYVVYVSLNGSPLMVATFQERDDHPLTWPEWSLECVAQDALLVAAAPQKTYKLNVGSVTMEHYLRFLLFCIDTYAALRKTIYGRVI